ncbi:2-hydroxyacylsphingosine 1-beta-galactosyltransferase-like [Liolophura sinensis]|uniref:2-hydroxyacylsphingosine 1-beta-galactosyltransferase-like n=1 Tax=Liolophura sinensis TaxID=3198878 RepID=UPI003158D77B
MAVFTVGRAISAKILLIPAPLYSHCLEVCLIGQELLSRGHQVVAYIISDFDTSDCPESMGIRVIQYKYVLGVEKLREFQDRYARMVLGNHTEAIDSFQLLNDAQNNTCWPILADEEAFSQLQKEKFDFAIADGFYTFACYLLIPYKLKIPYAVVSSLILDYPSVRPFLPNIKPHPFTHFTDQMSFMERVVNTIVTLTPYYMGIYLTPMDIVSRFAPEVSRRQVMDLVSQSELFLENTDSVLGYPFPLMPNVIQVGGISAGPPKQLPKTLTTFFEKSSEVIVVSFGSAFELPKEIIDKFMATFKLLDISVVWKTVDEGHVGKVLKTRWMPQNDVLGHSKTKAVIYHCGNNGLYEALYHAVPIICIPLLIDHKFNAHRIQSWEVGKVLDVQNFTPAELVADVKEVLTNQTYRKNMERVSQMYRDRPDTPRQRGAFWIEHLCKVKAYVPGIEVMYLVIYMRRRFKQRSDDSATYGKKQ